LKDIWTLARKNDVISSFRKYFCALGLLGLAEICFRKNVLDLLKVVNGGSCLLAEVPSDWLERPCIGYGQGLRL